MGTQNPIAPPRAQSAAGGNPTRPRHHTGGVIHENTRHTTRFTVIGNHLTQHRELSLLAIGLGCHIQSLPTGAPTDIKSLAARFKEGATRIAAALRELEAHGYLRRERVRTATGRIITRTVSCNQPGHRRQPVDTDCPGPPPHTGLSRVPARPSRRSPSPPRPPPPPSTSRPPTSSAPCAATTPASSSPPPTPHTSPPASPPGSNARSPPPPSVTPSRPTSRPTPSAALRPSWPTASRPSCHPRPRTAHRPHHPPSATHSAPATAATAPSAPRKRKPTAATAARKPSRLPSEHGTAPDR